MISVTTHEIFTKKKQQHTAQKREKGRERIDIVPKFFNYAAAVFKLYFPLLAFNFTFLCFFRWLFAALFFRFSLPLALARLSVADKQRVWSAVAAADDARCASYC